MFLKANEIKTAYCDSGSQEVTISFDKEGIAQMYVSYNPWITKMRKKVEEDPETFKCKCAGTINGKPTGYFFTFPAKLVNVRSVTNRAVSEENKQKTSERFKRLHAEGKLKRK